MLDLPPLQPISQLEYKHNNPNKAASYLYPQISELLRSHLSEVRHVIDIGCGTGDIAARLFADGYETFAFDASSDAITQARQKYPHLRLERRSIYDDLWGSEGPWDAVIATEVIEHLYYPRRLVSVASSILKPGGLLILTTPHHGYVKYLLLALTGRMDHHLQALRDHGHIKFFSHATIRQVLEEAEFEDIRICNVGRIGPIAKSMIASGRKAATTAHTPAR